jgi:uncharacterized membrane protein YfcA
VGAAEIAAIAAAGMAAGAINTLVGSGTLITFPVLLAFGYPPVTANVSNTIGLVPGSVAGAIGYRRDLEGQRTLVAGVYGGYFSAVQGILLLAILGLALPDDLQRVNALKNVLAGIVNAVAALVFIAAAQVVWGPAALIAAGSVVGAQLAAR